MHPVAILFYEADPPDTDSQQADGDAKFGGRTRDNPADASGNYSERDEIGQCRVAHDQYARRYLSDSSFTRLMAGC
jgi:hypothetical protein